MNSFHDDVVIMDIPMQLVNKAAGGSLTPVDAQWQYSADRPFHVVVEMSIQGEVVAWEFARELLQDAVAAMYRHDRHPVGLGDVKFSSGDPLTNRIMVMDLHGYDGSASLLVGTCPLNTFVNRSAQVVPFDDELNRVDIDAALHDLLSS